MSTKLATWLRVTPSPTTLAESSAIYQALSKQGRISVFARCKDQGHGKVTSNNNSSSSSTFYAVFPHEPPTLRTTFEVPVYHGLPSARDEDPFNIRGLQTRKPMPAPKTFSCVIEKVRTNEVKANEETIIKGNPYHGHFMVEKDGQVEVTLIELNAPPGLARGCGTRIQDVGGPLPPRDSDGQEESTQEAKERKINMGSLMDIWHEAKKHDASKERVSKESGSSTGKQILLNADTPLGKL